MVGMAKKVPNAITSVAEYIKEIQSKVKSNKGQETFFRGQTSVGTYKDTILIPWKLSPSIFRDNRLSHENEYYSYVMTECANEFNSCHNHCEILSTMQHYGVPTRLLDITSNALVALFFACVDEDGKVKPKENGTVFIIASDKQHIKDYDSDTISILSSLPRFHEHEKGEIRKTAETALNTNDPMKEFNDAKYKQVQRLLHEIKKEKPAFEPIIEPKHLLENFIFTPQKTNPRIIRQNGAFILFGLRHTALPDSNSEIKTLPYVIEQLYIDNKVQIRKELEQCGISLATMYPELYKVAEYLKNSKLKF